MTLTVSQAFKESQVYSKEERYFLVRNSEIDSRLIVCYTDGSTGKNANSEDNGGFAFSITEFDKILETNVAYKTTISNSNTCELLALESALVCLDDTLTKDRQAKQILIYSDSKNAVDGITKHLEGWIKNNFVGPTGLEIKNKDIWLSINARIVSLVEKGFKVQFNYVAGHEDRYYNEKVNDLAIEARSW